MQTKNEMQKLKREYNDNNNDKIYGYKIYMVEENVHRIIFF